MIKATSGMALLLLYAAIAEGSIITFDPPYCITCDVTLTRYEEDGVLFTGYFSQYGMGIPDTAANESDGAVRLSNQDRMSIQLSDGSAFSIETLDLAEFSFALPGEQQTVTFTGLKSNDTWVSQDFLIDGLIDGNGNISDYETFVFSPEFTNLKQVDINSTMFSMDNLNITAIPVPAAALLFISGFIGLTGLAGQKSRTFL